jgi:hypothetical protein
MVPSFRAEWQAQKPSELMMQPDGNRLCLFCKAVTTCATRQIATSGFRDWLPAIQLTGKIEISDRTPGEEAAEKVRNRRSAAG